MLILLDCKTNILKAKNYAALLVFFTVIPILWFMMDMVMAQKIVILKGRVNLVILIFLLNII